ncbi:MAG: hypothetical protein EXQ98_08285 [Alphaproteobacteria bacterium]|nr:hypothetical protein [Alphaproteobacteria bacterium]
MTEAAPHSHRYPLRTLIGDYGRAGVGLFFTVGPFAVTSPLPVVSGILAAFAALFFAYGARTVIRHCTVIRLSAKGMEASGPLAAHLGWDEMRGLSLRYFSTRRDRAGGWMQLRVKGARGSMRIDSTIDEFDIILERAARAARACGVALDSSTVENLRLRGVRMNLEDDKVGMP